MNPIISSLFRLPVRRVEVLKKVKKNLEKKNYQGLCHALMDVFCDYNLNTGFDLAELFPGYTWMNAIKFGATKDYMPYWWEKYNWKTGRIDFLNWLIEQYKDDKTNLRKL